MPQDEFEGVEVDVVDSDDNLEEVERAIRTVKEGIRGPVQGFLLRRTPMLMVRRIVEVAARHLSTFPSENGTWCTLRPLSIATEDPLRDTKSHQLDFGACE